MEKKFRIVSGYTGGFFAMSDTLTADQAVRVFLDLSRSFNAVIEENMLDQLKVWLDAPVNLYYIGSSSWRVALAPAGSQELIVTAN